MLTGLLGEELYVPPPRCCGGVVLFVDFDGCLHPDSVYLHPKHGPFLRNAPRHHLFEHAPLLEEVLAPYPQVRIVLSTSWVRRYRGSIARVARRLTPSLQARVIGAAYHSRMDANAFGEAPRGVQIWHDVLRRRPAAWLAIDDDDKGWPASCLDNLVRTDPVLGISEPSVVSELQAKLTAMCRHIREHIAEEKLNAQHAD
jgi:hypothetical protein